MTKAFKTLQNAAGQGSPQSVLWPGQQSLNKLEAESRAPAGQMDQALPPLFFRLKQDTLWDPVQLVPNKIN